MSEQLVIPEVQALTDWRTEAAEIAAAQAEKEMGAGQFFSISGGRLSFGGNAIPNNKMVVIVMDSVYEKTFYAKKDEEGNIVPLGYDPDIKTGPTCFAIGVDDKKLAPHPVVVEAGLAVSEKCGESGKEGCCPWNEFASAPTGKGKGCRDHRRLGLLPASTVDKNGNITLVTDPEFFETVTPGYLRVPPTSFKEYGKLIKELNKNGGLSTFAVYTEIYLEPGDKGGQVVKFKPLVPVSDEVGPVLLKRFKQGLTDMMSVGQPSEPVVVAEKPQFKGRKKYL